VLKDAELVSERRNRLYIARGFVRLVWRVR
jgi:hypothetical protein